MGLMEHERPARLEWRQKGQAQSFAWLMALRPEASNTELGTGHKQDMVPDARGLMLMESSQA